MFLPTVKHLLRLLLSFFQKMFTQEELLESLEYLALLSVELVIVSMPVYLSTRL